VGLKGEIGEVGEKPLSPYALLLLPSPSYFLWIAMGDEWLCGDNGKSPTSPIPPIGCWLLEHPTDPPSAPLFSWPAFAPSTCSPFRALLPVRISVTLVCHRHGFAARRNIINKIRDKLVALAVD
jgi:hypothetical protein